MQNHWNKLARTFDIEKNLDDNLRDAADNMLMAWPSIIRIVQTVHGKNKELSILNYGCGTGGFCHHLASLGYTDITGIDPAKEMIKVAKIKSSKGVTFREGDVNSLNHPQKYDVITSIMVFQFIENIFEVIGKLTNKLKKGGILIFAVFNPDYVKRLLKEKMFFEHFDSVSKPGKGFSNFGNKAIVPTFIRTAQEYEEIFTTLGFKKISEDYPPFTQEFIKTYAPIEPTDIPEFLILGYQKSV